MTNNLIFAAGLAQLGIALASLALPRILGWREQTARLEPLTRQVFWTYSAYILSTNIFFGAVSTLAPHWLTDGAPLARTLCGFIAAYWGGRVFIQLFAYHGASPQGWFFRVAEAVFFLAFLFCAVTYGGVALAVL